MNPIFALRTAWMFVKRWFKSAQARPYLDTAADYVETQLNDLLGFGKFDIDVDAASGVVYYRFDLGGIKYTINLTIGAVDTPEAVVTARNEAPTRDIEINLSEMVGYNHRDMLPVHLINAKLRELTPQD